MAVLTSQKQLEFRKAQRQRRLKQGKIIFPDHARVFDCQIQDWSETGAKLRMSNTLDMPREFELAIRSENLLVSAELKWRRGENVGVRFTGPFRNLVGKKAPLASGRRRSVAQQ